MRVFFCAREPERTEIFFGKRDGKQHQFLVIIKISMTKRDTDDDIAKGVMAVWQKLMARKQKRNVRFEPTG